MKAFLIILAFLEFYFLGSVKGQSYHEAFIFNSIIDSLYDINNCNQIIKPPYYKCCDQNLNGRSLIDCCEHSSIPEKYRVYCDDCINEADTNSLERIIAISDSLFTFDLLHKNYLLNQIPKNSKFYEFVMNIEKKVESKYFQYGSLKQRDIKFINSSYFIRNKKDDSLGNKKKKLFLGYLSFSRILFNEDTTLGIFKVDWRAAGNCGFLAYVLINLENNNWKIFKKVVWGTY